MVESLKALGVAIAGFVGLCSIILLVFMWIWLPLLAWWWGAAPAWVCIVASPVIFTLQALLFSEEGR